MTAPTTYRDTLEGKSPTLATLESYLQGIQGEEWNAEFKRAENGTDYQLRKAVASLSNHEGGEVFIGVRDKDRKVFGTTINTDSFYSILGQKGPLGDWYVLDLVPLVLSTIEVPLATTDKRAIVVEVRKAVLPGLVVEKDGALMWYERRGRTDHKLSGYEGVEARRKFGRGKLLRELYLEFDLMARTIPTSPYQGAPVAKAHFSLPRYEGARSDGTLYSSLVEDDVSLLLAGKPDANGRRTIGLLPRFISEGERLDRRIERYNAGPMSDWEAGPGNEIRVAIEDAKRAVDRFADHLRLLGLLPPKPP